MRKKLLPLMAIVLFPTVINAQKDKPVLKSEIDSVSYSMGMAIGTSIKQAGLKQMNDKLFMQALNEVITDKQTLLKTEQTQQILQAYFTKLQEKKGSENVAKGKKFLDDNKVKEGVVTLPSGLQYKVIKDGTGESPTINDKVTCHYHGTTIDGKVFDSSVQRGQPIQFAVNGVISGWTEALQLMKPGAKWTLYIPSELAYGSQGTGGIEPNSVLIFEVELISIEKGN